MLINVINPTYVYADDGTTTDPVAEETEEVEEPEEDTQTEETQETDPDPGEGEEGEATEPEEGVVTEPEEELAPEPTEEPVSGSEEAAPEEPDETDLTVAEVLEQAPEGTEVVVVNEEGEIEPLATIEATEILVEGDPMWCPNSADPGDATCTGSFATFDDLIAHLLNELDANVYGGDGTIYVRDNYDATLEPGQITFDEDVINTVSNGNTLADLVVQGGWDGVTGPGYGLSGSSTLNDALNIVNWNGNVTINDIIVDGATGTGIQVSTTGGVDLNDIIVDGATGTGLQVSTTGDITLNNVSSINNTNSGANLDSCQYDSNTDSCIGSGNITD